MGSRLNMNVGHGDDGDLAHVFESSQAARFRGADVIAVERIDCLADEIVRAQESQAIGAAGERNASGPAMSQAIRR